MHNIDRTVGEMEFGFENEFGNEFSNEFGEFRHEAGEFGEFGQEFSGEMEYGHEMGQEYAQEVMEMELATELLGVSNEAELEQFLGKLISKAASGIRNFAKSSAGKALGGVLKSVASKALPIAGSALGGLVGGPAGAAIGGKLAGMAGKAFGLELEGLSAEDKELEISRAYVRFAQDAARRASRSPYLRSQPRTAVRQSVVEASRRYAPGLMTMPSFTNTNLMGGNGMSSQSDGYGEGENTGMSGRWVRQGNRIILFGV